jgi:hypothetical protein
MIRLIRRVTPASESPPVLPRDRVLDGIIALLTVLVAFIVVMVWSGAAHAATPLQPAHSGTWQSSEYRGGFLVLVTPTTAFVTVFDRVTGRWSYAQSAPGAQALLLDGETDGVVGEVRLLSDGCTRLRLEIFVTGLAGTLVLAPTAPLPGVCAP